MSSISRSTEGAGALAITASGSDTFALSHLGTAPGVSITAVSGKNGQGLGKIIFLSGGIAWQAPGSSTPGAAVARQSGSYILHDGEDDDKWVEVELVSGWLPLGTSEYIVQLADTWDGLQRPPDTDSATASAGGSVTRLLTLTNVSNVIITNITAWITESDSTLYISDGVAAYTQPSTEAAGLDLGTLKPGETATLALRQTVSASAPADPRIDNRVNISWEGL